MYFWKKGNNIKMNLKSELLVLLIWFTAIRKYLPYFLLTFSYKGKCNLNLKRGGKRLQFMLNRRQSISHDRYMLNYVVFMLGLGPLLNGTLHALCAMCMIYTPWIYAISNFTSFVCK